jgi:hypothetical protein
MEARNNAVIVSLEEEEGERIAVFRFFLALAFFCKGEQDDDDGVVGEHVVRVLVIGMMSSKSTFFKSFMYCKRRGSYT